MWRLCFWHDTISLMSVHFTVYLICQVLECFLFDFLHWWMLLVLLLGFLGLGACVLGHWSVLSNTICFVLFLVVWVSHSCHFGSISLWFDSSAKSRFCVISSYLGGVCYYSVCLYHLLLYAYIVQTYSILHLCAL